MGRVRRRPALLALALAPLLGCPPDQSGQGLAPRQFHWRHSSS